MYEKKLRQILKIREEKNEGKIAHDDLQIRSASSNTDLAMLSVVKIFHYPRQYLAFLLDRHQIETGPQNTNPAQYLGPHDLWVLTRAMLASLGRYPTCANVHQFTALSARLKGLRMLRLVLEPIVIS